jgi:hypothetical protein
MNDLHEESQELKQLFANLYPDLSDIILQIGKDRTLDKAIRTRCPVSQCRIKGSRNYVLRYSIWPRLFSKDINRINKGIEYLKGLEARNV